MADISIEKEQNIQLKRQRVDSDSDKGENHSHNNTIDSGDSDPTTKKLKVDETDTPQEGIPDPDHGISPKEKHAFASQSDNFKIQDKEIPTEDGKGLPVDKQVEPEKLTGCGDPEVIELDSSEDEGEPSTSGIGQDACMIVNDDEDDNDDNISDISGMSDVSLEEMRWTSSTPSGPVAWIQRQMANGVDPRVLLKELIPKDTVIPEDLEDITLWKAVLNIIMDPPKRKKLPDVNTLEDAIELIKKSSKIMVLTGAGVSVSCGIPDFRSKDGIYSRLAVEYPDLPDPQAMFDIHYFTHNQKPFFKFAKEIYPGQFQPSTSHKFIKIIEDQGKLLRNYTQNIDTLEQVAGISNVIQCHGSFVNATCMICRYKVDHKVVEEDIMNQVIPRCPNCPDTEPLAIMKPDIVFFGESLPAEFHRQMEVDKNNCDLLIVMGSSLKVKPVALIPNALPAEVPQILINREPLKHQNFDVELLGNCDEIVQELCHKLGEGWTSLSSTFTPSVQISREEMVTPTIVNSEAIHLLDSSKTVVKDNVDSNDSCTNDKIKDSEEYTGGNLNDSKEQTSLSQSVKGDSKLRNDTVGECQEDEKDLNTEKHSQVNANVDGKKEIESDSNNTTEASKPLEVENLKGTSGGDNPIIAEIDKVMPEKENDGKCIAPKDVDKPTMDEKKVDDDPSQNKLDDDPSQKKLDDDPSQKKLDDDPSQSDPSNITSGQPESTTTDVEGKSSGDITEVPDGAAKGSSSGLSEKELEAMRACWKPRFINLGLQLKENTFLFLPPNRYIFKGADFLQDLDEVSEYSSASHISINDSSDEEDGDHNDMATDTGKKETDLLDDMTSGIDSTAESDDITHLEEKSDDVTNVAGKIDDEVINGHQLTERNNSSLLNEGAVSSSINVLQSPNSKVETKTMVEISDNKSTDPSVNELNTADNRNNGNLSQSGTELEHMAD